MRKDMIFWCNKYRTTLTVKQCLLRRELNSCGYCKKCDVELSEQKEVKIKKRIRSIL